MSRNQPNVFTLLQNHEQRMQALESTNKNTAQFEESLYRVQERLDAIEKADGDVHALVKSVLTRITTMELVIESLTSQTSRSTDLKGLQEAMVGMKSQLARMTDQMQIPSSQENTIIDSLNSIRSELARLKIEMKHTGEKEASESDEQETEERVTLEVVRKEDTKEAESIRADVLTELSQKTEPAKAEVCEEATEGENLPSQN